MSLEDPQTDAERDEAVCFVIARRLNPAERWRPCGMTLGVVARDQMLAQQREDNPGIEVGWVSLERAAQATAD